MVVLRSVLPLAAIIGLSTPAFAQVSPIIGLPPGTVVTIPRPVPGTPIVKGIAVAGNVDMEEINFQRIGTQFVYSARFTCGVSPSGVVGGAQIVVQSIPGIPPIPRPPPGAIDALLPPGAYATEISIHNPNAGTVTFTKRASLAFPQRVGPGKVGILITEVLQSDEAINVDCEDFGNSVGSPYPTLPIVNGIFVIRSPVRLFVNAFYTFKEMEILFEEQTPQPIFVVPGPHPESQPQ